MAYNITKQAPASTTKKLLFLITVIVSILVINSLAHSVYDLWHKQDLVTSAQTQLNKEKSENQNLKKQLKIVSSTSFIEEEARDKLFLVKPGEAGVILPAGFGEKSSGKKEVNLSNWQKWLQFFIGK